LGRGVSSTSSVRSTDGVRKELRSDLISGSSKRDASATILSSGSTSDFGGVLAPLNRFVSTESTLASFEGSSRGFSAWVAVAGRGLGLALKTRDNLRRSSKES
jgi:hypothetical protein